MTNEETHLAGASGRALCGVAEDLYIVTDARGVSCKACLRAEIERLRALRDRLNEHLASLTR
jgi:hypothetical protein